MALESRRDYRRALPDLFDWTEGLPGVLGWPSQLGPKGIRVEEYMDKDRYIVRAELPGVEPEKDVSVHVANGMLTIRAERQEQDHEGGRSEFRYGSFTRRVELPEGAEESGIKARYEGGILDISVPLTKKPEEAPREVTIEHK